MARRGVVARDGVCPLAAMAGVTATRSRGAKGLGDRFVRMMQKSGEDVIQDPLFQGLAALGGAGAAGGIAATRGDDDEEKGK